MSGNRLAPKEKLYYNKLQILRNRGAEMITIKNETVKIQKNFWNNCLFHPTDAVEDAWGRRILDQMAEDGAVQSIRIYSMLEDIVYLDGNDNLCYDFRVSDLRLDYLLEKGYNILLAYAGMPECIASDPTVHNIDAKGFRRYKGKVFNTSPPADYALYEEVCYAYTKHNVERYGIDVVSTWHCHCHNEPDLHFFMNYLPDDDIQPKIREYCKLYAAFQRGVRRVSERILIGGPACAFSLEFIEAFLNYVRENNLKLDYIALHNYGTCTAEVNAGTRPIKVQNNIDRQRNLINVIEKCGFGETERVVDEWGASTDGYYNMEDCPAYIFRETEVYSAYYTRLIHDMIRLDPKLTKMMICLSGQHEMVTDFSGFRNFFTLNFIRKPIYNAHILASKLGQQLLSAEHDTKDLFVVPTKREDGSYAVLLSYASEYFTEDLPQITERLQFTESIDQKTVTVWCIDKTTTNPYRLYEKLGISTTPTREEIRLLREEGTLKPVVVQSGSEALTLTLTPNCTYLITAE